MAIAEQKPYSFMDVNWQYNNPPNPADVTIGPSGYDNHLYYSFGVCIAISVLSLLINMFHRALPMRMRRRT